MSPILSDELLDESDQMGKLGSSDDGDSQTTNLYVDNLSPQVDKDFLLRTFGTFGPIASVELMSPGTDEELRRQKSCGFVAFMKRPDAEAAKDGMQGAVAYEYEWKIGWGKSVTPPSQALPAPPPGPMVIRSKFRAKDIFCCHFSSPDNHALNPVSLSRCEPLIETVMVNIENMLSPSIKDLIAVTWGGLVRGKKPTLSETGTSGVYFMRDSCGKRYSVFKPVDEEARAINNPFEDFKYSGSDNDEGFKDGSRIGQGAIREVAAYILDHPRSGPRLIGADGEGYAGVPATVMVKCPYNSEFVYVGGTGSTLSKYGSLQLYMVNLGNVSDVICEIQHHTFSEKDVRKICLLDIRLQFVNCNFTWLNWKQAAEPLTEDEIAYVECLNAEDDITLLKSYGWNVPDNVARVLHVSTMLLKKGAKNGMTFFDMGSMLCNEDAKSVMEEIVEKVEKSMPLGASLSDYLQAVSRTMDGYMSHN